MSVERPESAGAGDEGELTPELAEDLARQDGSRSAESTADDGVFDDDATAADTAVDPTPPVHVPRRRRNVVGPFSLRQVTIALAAVMASAIVFTVATVPIAQLVPNLPVPDPSAFLIGPPIPGLTVGDLAPELTVDDADGAQQLTDLHGRPIRLADLRGKAVWINYWASWCPPCQFETPTLRAIDQRYRDRGLVVVGIQVQQTVQVGIDYAERYDLDYAIGADVTGAFFHLYRVFALPTQFFIDRDGRIVRIINGPMSEAEATAIIESMLPPPGSAAPQASADPAGT